MSYLSGFYDLLIPGIISGTLASITITTMQVIHLLAFDLLFPEILSQFTFPNFFHDFVFLI